MATTIRYVSVQEQNATYSQGFALGQRLHARNLTLHEFLQHSEPAAATYTDPLRRCFMYGVEWGWKSADWPLRQERLLNAC